MINEQELIKRAQDGEEQALSQLYEENFTKVYRYIYARVGSTTEAEDLTQQVFLKVLDSIGKYRWQGAPFIAWVLRIAHNQVIDYYRRKGKHREVPIDERMTDPAFESAGDDPCAMAETNIEIERVVKMLQRLPPAQKEVVALRFTAGLSVAEAAQALGKSEGTIKALQFNAMVSLRKLLYGERNVREH